METDYSFVWVLLIAAIGIAASIYSLCKGCRGYSDRGVGARALVAPYAGLLQQMRAEAARAGLFSISGSSVGDKNPPTYDELFLAPPPSYEESLKMLKGGFDSTDKANNNVAKESTSSTNDDIEKTEVCTKQGHCVQIQPTVEVGLTNDGDDTVAECVAVLVQEENEELERRRTSSMEIAATHCGAVVVDVERQRHSAPAVYECAETRVDVHCA